MPRPSVTCSPHQLLNDNTRLNDARPSKVFVTNYLRPRCRPLSIMKITNTANMGMPIMLADAMMQLITKQKETRDQHVKRRNLQ